MVDKKDIQLINFIKVYDNVFPTIFISKLIRTANDKFDFKKALTVNGIGEAFEHKSRVCSDYNIGCKPDNYTEMNLKNTCIYHIGELSKLYRQECCPDLYLDNVIEITMLKYTEGGKYDRHVDNAKSTPRELSCIVYLNDDYQGGNTTFYKPNTREVLCTVTPKSGRAVFWPSNFLFPHQANPVTKGTRYIIVSWLN